MYDYKIELLLISNKFEFCWKVHDRMGGGWVDQNFISLHLTLMFCLQSGTKKQIFKCNLNQTYSLCPTFHWLTVSVEIQVYLDYDWLIEVIA